MDLILSIDFVKKELIKGPFPPSRSYVEIMLTGARDLELDPEYIKKIEGFYRQGQ